MDALTAFHFLRPWWLLALPLWLWLSFYIWRKGANGDGWAAVCDPALLSYLTGDATATQQRSNMALIALLLAGSLALLALAGPVWKQLPQPVYRAQSALVIGLDLSRSMLAEDMKPNRLQRAKLKLQDILAARKEGQTALVVFAGAAFDVVPLTSDNRAILAMLDALEPSMMPAQGSRASSALIHAKAIFKRNAIQRGTVLLLTDGVDADALDEAKKLVKAGHTVSVIGVGTADGAPIPEAGESGGFVKDRSGNIVIPRLDTSMLRDLARTGHGVYEPIRFDGADIDAIPGLKTAMTDQISRQEKLQTDLWREEGPWLLLLVLPLLALAFRRGVLLALLPFMMMASLMMPDRADAMAWKDWWQTPDQQGQALMRAKKPKDAAALFRRPDWKGASLYRAKQYKQAAQALANVPSADGWYNRGNALAKAGDLKAALAAYNQALKLDPNHKDAAFNRELVKKAMQQSQQKQSDKQKKSDQQKKSDKQNSKQQRKNRQGQKGGKNNHQDKSASQQNSDQEQSGRKKGKEGGQENHASAAKASDQQKDKQQQSEQQSAAQNKDQKQQDQQQTQSTQQSDGKRQEKANAARAMEQKENKQDKEKSAALKQWLRRIPDDPGGLLRRKFRYQYQQQGQSNGAGDAW